ncbi:calcium-binding tyrosine phosphorylation-regulated protein [Calonectris borealis]|uniref:calcium-binding tyrosine phosphorylation-regulated protein n=1 Tax=Calonectris borealis TaxID=1323832 RepID=UPI003F4B3816
MQSSKTSLVVPHGLKTLLEGVSRAVIENNPDDIIEFVALYFQELVAFRKGNPNLDITELVEQFKFVSEEKTSEYTDTLFAGEPKQRDKCTDTEEDQLLEEPDIEYRSKITQYPSTARSIAEGRSLPGFDGASSPEGPDLVYVPAEAAQLAAHELGNSDSLYSVRDVAASVQTLYEDSQTSENEFTPVERAAKDASAVPAAEASLEALRSQPGVWSQSSIAGELGPSDSQAGASTNDVNQASSVPLWEEPSPLSPSPSPAPKDPLQAGPSCHEAEVTSTTEVVSLHWDDKLIMDAEVPPYVEQFPEKITMPFVDQTAYPLKIEQPLDAGQGSSATTLGPSVDDLVCYPKRMESTAQAESAEQVYVLSEEKTSEYTDTLFSGEPKQRDKCTDTEEDQLLEEPDIEYRSKITQYPSTARSIAEGRSLPGSDGASSPEGPDLVYVPAEAAQLAAHELGNSDSLYSVRDVAASVQTLYEDSQTSENEFTPVGRAAKDASAVPAAEASLEALRSQPGAWSQSSIAGELGPSDSQADASTNDVNQASSVPLWEEPSPLSPSPAPKDPLQAGPSCHEAEVTSTTEVVSLYWAKLIMDAEVPHYVEQFPEKITIPFIDQTACMLKVEQPLDAGQGSSATTLGPSVDDLVCYPKRMESTAQAESAEQVYVLSAMASSEAGQPPLHSNVWTLYRLTDLRQGQKSPPSLSSAGAGVPYSQATLSLSRGEDQQCGQLSQVSAPIYVIQEESKRRDAPPFILVGSNVQNIQDGKPIPQLSHISAPIYVVQEERTRRDAPPFILVGSNVQHIQDWKPIPQLSQASAPIYVMQEKCKKRDAPPFILVGSNIQNIQDWKPIPSHAAFAQQGTGARRRFTTAPVPVARPADEKTDTASPSSNSAEETAAKPCTPHVFSVAIPLDDVISAKKGSPADDTRTG